MKRVVSHGLWGLFWLLLLGCKSDTVEPRTEVLLQIDAERLVKLSAERLVVELSSGPKGGTLSSVGAAEEFDLTSEDFNWPASMALLARAGHEGYAFEVTIDIETNGKRVARSRVRSTFVKHETLLLKTLLYGECLGNQDCSGSQTCVAPDGKARCDSADIDATTLPHYTTGEIAGTPAADGGKSGAGSGGKGGAGESGAPAAGSGDEAGQGGASDGGSGASAGAPACDKQSPEQCNNGIDDDCNGKIDCADPACDDMQCVANGMVVGVLVPADSPCPSGFDKGEQLLHRGLMDPGCGGCSCDPVPTTCTPNAFFYANSAACTADLAPYSGGTKVTTAIPKKPDCSATPIGASISMDSPPAWRVKVTKSADACSSSGTARPLPPTWSTSMKLCVTTAKRNGCDAGSACVPKPDTGKLCTQREVAACPAATTLQTWQREYTDERTCGPCGCAAQGGSCSDIVVSLGHDWSCASTDSSLHDGEKACVISTYMPPASYDGSPVNPTCMAGAQVNGMLKTSMPLDLCCAD